MSGDIHLVSLFLKNRNAYERFYPIIPKELLQPESAIILHDLGQWYASERPMDVRAFWEEFKLIYHPSFKLDKLKVYHAIIGNAMKLPESDVTANKILEVMVLREHAAKIALEADRFANGESKDLFDKLPVYVEQALVEANIANDNDEVSEDIGDIIERLMNIETGLSWRTEIFNVAAGPIRGGNFVVLAAYVDSGKTSLLASEITYMAPQLDKGKKVLWFNNEDAGSTIKSRLYTAATGMTLRQQYEAGAEEVRRQYDDLMGDENRIILIDKASITPADVKAKLRKYNTGLVVFDQLHNITGVQTAYKANGSDILEAKFRFGRELAKDHDIPVITSHQAQGQAVQDKGGTPDNDHFLEMHELAGSRQALQATADLIVTMGRNPKDTDMSRRYFNFVKNKLPTPGNPLHRQLRATLSLNHEIARFK